MILPRSIYNTAPPEPRTRLANNPTLLFSWWCTCFSLVIILFRLCGRYVRTERFFREDRIMALSIIPLFARMGFVHVILIYGTNNVDITNLTNSTAIRHRQIGSGLVLAARIFYAAFIWTAKLGVCEFLARIIETFWKRSYEITLRCIRYFLLATFIAVVIATLGECQPFNHYWQVIPDPGPSCRQGYAQLITMGTCDILTDILLVAFPIPMVLKSAVPFKRKIRLVLLFSMSIILICVTAIRVPSVIEHLGRQQYRTVFASGEILGAAAVSNAIVLGSFLRDRGVKKQKYKFGSTTDSTGRQSERRPTMTTMQWGSDEDLVREVGYRLSPELEARSIGPRPAPIASPASPESRSRQPSFVGRGWQFPGADTSIRDSEESDLKTGVVEDPNPSPRELRTVVHPKHNLSFFDVGGLMDYRSPSLAPTISAPSPTASSISAQDFAASTSRRPSRALMHDLGALKPPSHRSSRQCHFSVQEGECYELTPRGNGSSVNGSPATSTTSPGLARTETDTGAGLAPSLQDVGGLLGVEEGQARGRLTSQSSAASNVSPTSSSPVEQNVPPAGNMTRFDSYDASRAGGNGKRRDGDA